MKRLFGSSGVRGVVNRDLKAVTAIKIGLALAHRLDLPAAVALAHDTRITSSMVTKALSSGLLAGGADVVSLGLVPTPALAYITTLHNYGSGAMVTASHNPPEYNGVKIFDSHGVAITEEDCERIEEDVAQTSQATTVWSGAGEFHELDLLEEYVIMASSIGSLSKRRKVVIDPGNGATSKVAPLILRNIGCDVITINAHEDGFFPGRPPEPSGEGLNPLRHVVREVRADIGIAHDSDGDRIVIVDEHGEETRADQLLAAYAAHCVEEHGGGDVIVNIDTSQSVDEYVSRVGGKVVRTRVGDAYVAQRLVKGGGIFGGETSGAWIHPKSHYCPDGPLSSVMLLLALERKSCSMSEFVSDVPTFPVARVKLDCPNQKKTDVMESISVELSTMPDVDEVHTMDGTRVSFTNGSWVLVRPSGTEPIIRVTAEAKDDSTLDGLLSKVEGIVKQAIKA